METTGKTIAGAAGALALAALTGFTADYISTRDTVKMLAADAATNARQDAELAELRGTLRDLMLLTRMGVLPAFTGSTAPVTEDNAALPMAEPPIMDARPVIAPELEEESYEAFRTEQMDLEALMRERGLDPAAKPRPPISRGTRERP